MPQSRQLRQLSSQECAPCPNTRYFCPSVSVIALYSKMKMCFLPPEPFLRSLWLVVKPQIGGEFVLVNKCFSHVTCTFRFSSSWQGQRRGSHRDQEGEGSTYVPVTPESSNNLRSLNVPSAKRSFSRDWHFSVRF